MKKIFVIAATVAAVVCDYFSAPAQALPLTSDLIGYWEGNGNANDSSSTGNNGSFSGSYAPGTNGQQAFNLATGTVTIPNISAYANLGNNFTLGFWFNFNGHSASPWDIISQDVGGGPNPKWVVFYDYGGPGFVLHINGPSFAFLDANSVTIAPGWNQFTLTKSGSDYEFYLDGKNIGSANFAGTFPAPNAPLQFGSSDGGAAFPGLLENVVLYNTALTASEVQSLATPLPPTWTIMLLGLAGLGFFAYRGTKNRAAGPIAAA